MGKDPSFQKKYSDKRKGCLLSHINENLRIRYSWIQVLRQYHQKSVPHHLQPLLFGVLVSLSAGLSPQSWENAHEYLQACFDFSTGKHREGRQLSLLSQGKELGWPCVGHMPIWADYCGDIHPRT